MAFVLLPLLFVVILPTVIVVAMVVAIPLFLVVGSVVTAVAVAGSVVATQAGVVVLTLAVSYVRRFGPSLLQVAHGMFIRAQQLNSRARRRCEGPHDMVLVLDGEATRFVCSQCSSHHDAESQYYSCTQCSLELCLSCYDAEQMASLPTQTICLPFHSLFEPESITRSLVERGYALVELTGLQRDEYEDSISRWRHRKNHLSTFKVEETQEGLNPFMRELKFICLTALPSTDQVTNATATLNVSLGVSTPGTPTVLEASEVNSLPPLISAYIIDQTRDVGGILKVVDKRVPGLWLNVSSSLYPTSENRVFACLLLGRSIRSFYEDARLGPCTYVVGDPSIAEDNSSYLTLDLRAQPPRRKQKRGRLDWIIPWSWSRSDELTVVVRLLEAGLVLSVMISTAIYVFGSARSQPRGGRKYL